MMKSKIYYILFVLLVIASWGNSTIAQTKKPAKSKLMVIARPYKDSVLLRWAPDNARAWQLLNKEGYIIKRATISRNGKLIPWVRFEALSATLKPLPKAAWESFVIADDKYGTIAAQALYGEDFEITQEIKGNPGQLLNMIKQNEQRFSYALFSADQSFKVAKAMGLAFADTTTKSNEKYQYLIISAVGKGKLNIDTGRVISSFADAKPLPKPTGLSAVAQEKKGVMLSWLIKPLLGLYTYYQVERSEDGGKSYANTSDIPVINTQSSDNVTDPDKAFELDSVSALDRVLIYRVKGVSPFGEVGPPSDTISVTAFHQLSNAPAITNAREIKGIVKIDWTMPATEAEVLGFDVERSINNEKGFAKVNAVLLSSKDSSYIDLHPNNINFYRIKVYGKGGISLNSYSSMVQMTDSIPPAPPKEMKGQINKGGIVKLQWKTNTEPDMFGYRVYRSNSEGGEYAQVSKTTRMTANYTDTITLKTLSKYIYYKLVAIDKHYNPSNFSEVLKLKRPDIIPPVPPVFTGIKALSKGIYLSWYNSSSEDVVKHEILRTPADQEKWEIIKTVTDTTKTLTDESAVLNQKYQYKVKATDDSGLTSESKAAASQRLDLGIKPSIVTFSGTPDRDNQQIILKWTYKEPGVVNYILYKAEVNKPLRLYQTIDPKLKNFNDTQLYINTLYQYRIKAVFADGKETGFSKEIIVTY